MQGYILMGIYRCGSVSYTHLLEALKIAPQKVKEFISGILEKVKKQEKSIYYEPISAREQQLPEREKRSKNKDYER